MNKKTIIIATSKFGNPVSDYFKNLAQVFYVNDFNVIFIFDGRIKNLPVQDNQRIKYYTWPSSRPTKFIDFLFLFKIIRIHKPIISVSNFGSTNVMTIMGFLLFVQNRFNYVHTTSTQLSIDYKGRNQTFKLLQIRKKIIYMMNTHLFTNSLGTKEDIINTYNIKNQKISVLPLLLKESNIQYKNFNKRDFSLCIVGRLDPSKGHKKLLFLFQKCLDKYPDLILNIIGDGVLKNDLIELAKLLDISKNVRFLGKIPNEEVGKIYSNSIASISSSIEEAYGLVNIEALREGTPLLCTKTSGSNDIVKENFNGEFFYLDNELSLLSAFERILHSWSDYSLNAKKSFQENFSIENCLSHFVTIENMCKK